MNNLNHLKYFYHVAKNLSFTTAASELCITQSAVTKRMQVLEEECGLKLFGKIKGKIILTKEGEVFYRYTKKIIEQEKDLERAIGEMKALKRGTLRLGMPSTFSQMALSLLMDTFHGKYPHIRIKVNEGNSTELMDGILNRRHEIASLTKIEDHPEIKFVLVSRQEIKLIMSPSHRLAGAKSVSFKDLKDEPIVLREKGSGTRKLLMELFEKKQYTPNVILETSTVDNIINTVQRGECVSFLGEGAISGEINRNKLISLPIRGEELHFGIYLAWLKDMPLSTPARAYVKLFFELSGDSSSRFIVGSSWKKEFAFLQ